jgi:hypothetical protein
MDGLQIANKWLGMALGARAISACLIALLSFKRHTEQSTATCAHFFGVWSPSIAISMTGSSKDTAGAGADAAGGEAIYSSDGLPPPPAPVPPIRSAEAGDADNNDGLGAGAAVLDSDSMSPADAFEVFGGRAYLRPGGGGSRNNNRSTGAAVEPPLVRLARLSAELTDLERDLAASSGTAAAAAAAGGGTVSNDELTKLAGELSSRLEVLSNRHGVAGSRTWSDNLTRLVREELAKTTAAASEGGGGSGGGGGGIVYELYASSSTGHAAGPASASAEAAIEERLGRIERAVGSIGVTTAASQPPLAAAAGASGGGASSGRTVLERLEEAERMAGRVDAKALDAAAARAKVIR